MTEGQARAIYDRLLRCYSHATRRVHLNGDHDWSVSFIEPDRGQVRLATLQEWEAWSNVHQEEQQP